MDDIYRAKAKARLLGMIRRDPHGCWLYTGRIDHKGYGKFWLDGRAYGAHRAAYLLLAGAIPNGAQLDHLCRVRHCVNPEHLEPVTCKENLLRSSETLASTQLARTHCPQGHPYDEANTVIRLRGSSALRECRICRRERRRRWHAQRKARAEKA